MRTRYTLSWWIAISFLLLTMGVTSAFSEDTLVVSGPRLQSLDKYTRIQIPLGNGATFRQLKGSTGRDTKIQLDRVKASQLSALSSLNDKRVESIRVKASAIDQAEVEILFRKEGTDSFAYLQGQPPVLVLDLWQEAQKKTNPVSIPIAQKPKNSKPKVVKREVAQRKIASVDGEKKTISLIAPLRLEHDIFQKLLLPMPELKLDAKGSTLTLPPTIDLDALWKFSEKKNGEEDGKSFEFAKKLYKDGKYGLTIKTIEITMRDYPKSPLLNELKLLQAFSYRKLGESTKTSTLVDRADQMLMELASIRDENGLPLPFHRQLKLFFGEKAFLQGNWIDAISHFEYVSGALEQSDPDYPFLEALLAESYIKVNEPRRAERIFRFIKEHFPKHVLAKESAYRTADLLASEKNYQRVTEEGESALEEYPEYEKTRSEVLFQIGEAYFWLGKYSLSDKYFHRFINIASANTISALAWVRIGEISEIAKKDLVSARESYNKAKNGYPFSPGDVAAKVRLARIDLNIEKDPEFIVKGLGEILSDRVVDWDVRRAAELVLADYYLVLNRADDAIDIAKRGMKETEGAPYEAYKSSYIRALFSKWNDLVQKKQFAAAIALYNSEGKWLDLYGPESFRTAADMYRGLGLYSTSNTLMEKYAHALRASNGRSIASTSGLGLSRAKNSFARGNYAETLSSLPQESDAEILYMKAMSESHLKRREAPATAEKTLRAFRGQGESVTDEMVENITDILIEHDDAERNYAEMERHVDNAIELLKKENERLIFAKADALWYQKHFIEAVVAYREGLKKFTKGPRVERAKYNLGMCLLAAGKRDDAVKTLTELKDSSQSLWSESARRELELLEWETKYSSVLRTLPPSGLGIAN